jgi:hypothetical protein
MLKGTKVQDTLYSPMRGTVVSVSQARARKGWASLLVDWQNGVRSWQFPYTIKEA